MLSASANQSLNLRPSLPAKENFDFTSTHAAKQKIDQQTLNDYLAFFTTRQGADMTKYTYFASSEAYTNLIKHSKDYYVFNDDIMSITQHEQQIQKHLLGISDIVEVGPGPEHSLMHKTINILNYAKNLKRYYAIDNYKEYLDNACHFIKSNTSGIEVIGISADLMQQHHIELNKTKDGKKCILLLGTTLGNFDKKQQNYCIQQISKLTNTDDLFIFSADTNQDKNSLISAYSNEYSSKLIMGVLDYFAKINPDFSQHLSSFEVKCRWDKLSRIVDMYFVSKKDLFFEIQKNVKVIIKKGQEFRGIKAYKHNKQEITTLLNTNNFEVLEILSYSGKMQLFICKRS